MADEVALRLAKGLAGNPELIAVQIDQHQEIVAAKERRIRELEETNAKLRWLVSLETEKLVARAAKRRIDFKEAFERSEDVLLETVPADYEGEPRLFTTTLDEAWNNCRVATVLNWLLLVATGEPIEYVGGER